MWGRSVENRDENLDRKIDVQTQKTDNALRAISGQLASASTQITELYNRRTHVVNPADLSISNNATTSPPSVTRTFSFPAPEGGARTALVFISADLTTTQASTQQVRAFVDMSYQGVPRAATDVPIGAGFSQPSWYSGKLNFQFYTTVANGETPDFTLRLARLGFTSTSTTVTASNITAIIQYGDQV